MPLPSLPLPWSSDFGRVHFIKSCNLFLRWKRRIFTPPNSKHLKDRMTVSSAIFWPSCLMSPESLLRRFTYFSWLWCNMRQTPPQFVATVACYEYEEFNYSFPLSKLIPTAIATSALEITGLLILCLPPWTLKKLQRVPRLSLHLIDAMIFRYHDKISNFILMEPWLLPMTQVINIVTGLQFEQPVQAQESQGLETSLWDSMWGDWWL